MAGTYDYTQMLDLVAQYYGSGSDQWLKVTGAQGASADELLAILKQTPGVETLVTESGQYAGWRLASQESYGVVSNVGSLVNSNTAGGAASVQSSGLIQVPGQFAESAGTVAVKSGAVSAGTKALQFVSGTVVPATIAVATGLKLGYTIDKALYDINPNIFTYLGAEGWNPDVMKEISLIYREEGLPLQEKLWNGLWGINPDDSTTQLYAEETQFAYMAGYLQSLGAFVTQSGVDLNSVPISHITYPNNYVLIAPESGTHNIELAYVNSSGEITTRAKIEISVESEQGPVYIFSDIVNGKSKFDTYFGTCSKYPHTFVYKYKVWSYGTEPDWYSTQKVATTFTDGYNETYYSVKSMGSGINVNTLISSDFTFSIINRYTSSMSDGIHKDICTYILHGTIEGPMTGISTQPGAKYPTIPNTTNISDIISALKQQYPELWDSAVTNDVLQPDGSIKTFTYLPLPTPTTKSKYDTQPTGDGSEQNQNDTDVKPDSDTQIKDSTTTTIVSPPATPNPPDTGGGDSPTVVPPVGKASSLWSIYNPTLEQVNQFGSWLWSSNFVEQLKKLFNDPMQAIIGLHKVYSPVQTSGQGTIKCGYLDSEVPSKLVSEQYVTVDCGSVDIQEYFGNVFDYPPYTEISIYLPFIGIRQLDPSDVMRSTISVKYHVDVLTGACLAEVNVQRDASGGTLYTFSGDAAVRYPVSSGSYMGIVSGLIGVATSLVSGNLLPALGGATRLHTNVDRSGSFTGNSGAMGSKVPYLIISRPQTAMADKFETLSGYPSNIYTPLSACKGFTQVKYCHVENLSATETEKNEIERLLKEGVIL